jgi:hypothetical protein
MVEAASTFLVLGDRSEALRWVRQALERGYAASSLRSRRIFRTLERDPEFEGILAEGSRTTGAGIERWTEEGRP